MSASLRFTPPPSPTLFGPSLRVHAPPRLPQVLRVARSGPVLIAGKTQVTFELELTVGRRAAFPFEPLVEGDEHACVRVYADTLAQLEHELAARGRSVRAVVMGGSADPCPPWPDVQAETGRVVEMLAERGIDTLLLTRGYIRPSVQAILGTHRAHVRVVVGMMTLDRALQRTLEPLAASPRLRLRLLRQLRAQGVPTQAAVQPLVPGLTDRRDDLTGLLEALAEVGIAQVVAGYLVLRPALREALARALAAYEWEVIADAYAPARLSRYEGLPPAYYVPKPYRQRSYATLMALAARLGIVVRLDAHTNPDFLPPASPDPGPRQRCLPGM